MATALTPAQVRRDQLAATAERCGLSIERNDLGDGRYELVVVGRFEMVQVIVRSSRGSRTAVWAQIWSPGRKAKRLAARGIATVFRSITGA